MLLGFSFAKAQLVTMYDLVRKDLKITNESILGKETKRYSLTVPNQNISLTFSIFERVIFEKGISEKMLSLSMDNVGKFNVRNTEDGLWTAKVGNRNHLVRIDSGKNKYVYAFFDDQPNPMDEFNKKLQEKGF